MTKAVLILALLFTLGFAALSGGDKVQPTSDGDPRPVCPPYCP